MRALSLKLKFLNMKRLSLIIPIFAILFAVTGAFAMNSMNIADPETVWYHENANGTGDCVSEVLEPCAPGTINECTALTELGSRQIFKNQLCDDPYTRQP